MALPNLSGLSLHAAAPTQELVTLDAKQAARLNRGEEKRGDGREPLTLEEYSAGEYFRVRKRPTLGGEPRDELFDYDYLDPDELWKWAEDTGQNPLNRQRLSDADYHELWLRQIQPYLAAARAQAAAREGMTLEQYDARLDRQEREREELEREERERHEAEERARAQARERHEAFMREMNEPLPHIPMPEL